MFDRYGDPRELPRQLIGNEVVDKVDQVWGLNSEGEDGDESTEWEREEGRYVKRGQCRRLLRIVEEKREVSIAFTETKARSSEGKA